MDKYEALKLENQLCFPLYAAAKEVVRKYKPYLEKLNLTYTQYITLMVLWEEKTINVKNLGDHLYLDSGTLTPLLKKMEAKGWITRQRSKLDERILYVTITEKGMELRDECLEIPQKMGACLDLGGEDFKDLYNLLYKVLNKL